jgi:hypothetical protein
LTVTGTPEELDREFSGQLVAFTGSFVKAGSNLAEIEAAHATALKTVEAERKKELENKRKGSAKVNPPPCVTKPVPEIKDGKPVFGSKSSPMAATPSLFESPEAGDGTVEPHETSKPKAAPQSNPDAVAETGTEHQQPTAVPDDNYDDDGSENDH